MEMNHYNFPICSMSDSTTPPAPIELQITTLPQTFRLASIRKASVEYDLKALLKLIFFSKDGTLFSYTETEEEISLILDTEAAKLFPSVEGLVLVPETLRAIEVVEGSDAINSPGYVQKISKPLADIGISILYLSSYTADLILVNSRDLAKAEESLAKLTKTAPIDISEPPLGLKNIKESLQTKKMLLTPLSHKLSLVMFKKQNISQLALNLLQLFFFDDSDDRYFSFTIRRDEVSMIVDQNFVSQFPQDLVHVHPDTWEGIEITAGTMSSLSGTVGIVSSISYMLAKNQISIYYLSTFTTDFLFVKNNMIEKSMSCLMQKD